MTLTQARESGEATLAAAATSEAAEVGGGDGRGSVCVIVGGSGGSGGGFCVFLCFCAFGKRKNKGGPKPRKAREFAQPGTYDVHLFQCFETKEGIQNCVFFPTKILILIVQWFYCDKAKIETYLFINLIYLLKYHP